MKNPFKKKEIPPPDMLLGNEQNEDSFKDLGELNTPNQSLIEDIAELLKMVIALIHSKREDVFIERYTTGYTYANKNGRVYFKTYEQAKVELADMNWEEPEPNPQLNPFEAMSLPKEVTKHHL